MAEEIRVRDRGEAEADSSEGACRLRQAPARQSTPAEPWGRAAPVQRISQHRGGVERRGVRGDDEDKEAAVVMNSGDAGRSGER